MAKTLFNTSEKSNFILNLTPEKYSKMASFTLLMPFILIPLATIPCEFNVEKISYPIISGALSVCGVLSMIMAIIAFMKGYIKKDKLLPVSAFGFMIFWGVVSVINSYDKTVSFYGFDGRGEGLLAIIFYFCFFITASSVSFNKFKLTIFDGAVLTGAVNSLWSLMQIFIESFPSKYDYVSSAKDINAVSGLSQSPIFLAMSLSLSLTVSIIGSICLGNKKRRIFYIVSAVMISFTMVFTYSLTSWIGFLISLIAGVVTIAIMKKGFKEFLKIVIVAVSSISAVVLISSGAVCENTKYKLHDGALMWFDSFNRLSASGNYNPEEIEIEDTSEVYGFINGETIKIIKKYPLTGTGPENLIYPQLYKSLEIIENNGTFDKNYNEYLYVAGTRGIPSLIAFLTIVITVLITGFKKLRKDKSNEFAYVSFSVVVMSSVIFVVSVGNIIFSPLYWIFAGILISNTEK